MNKRILLALLFVLLFSSLLFATNEVEFFDIIDLTKCFTIERKSDHYYWNTNTSAFAASVPKGYAAINLTEAGSAGKGSYLGTLPPAIETAGDYIVRCWDTSAANFDPNNSSSGGYIISWSGTAEITDYTIWVDVNDVDDTVTVIAADAVIIKGYTNPEDFNTVQDVVDAIVADTNFVVAKEDANQAAINTNLLYSLVDDSKFPAQIKGSDDIDFTTTQLASLNDATPAVTVSDKTGFELAADGLDLIAISEPSGDPDTWTWAEEMKWLYMSRANKSVKNASTKIITVYNSSDVSVTEQTYSTPAGQEIINRITEP